MKRSVVILLALVSVFIAACQPAAIDEGELPTLAVLPTLIPTGEITLPLTEEAAPTEPTAPPTDIPARATPLTVASPTPEDLSTQAPAQPTQHRTQPTLSPEEEPRIMTLPPGGATRPNATPQVLADFVISEEQFQTELGRQLQNVNSVEGVTVDFVPEGMNLEVTAMGGQALVTGNVSVSVQLTGNFATITLGQITTNAPEPPEAFILTIGSDLFPALVATMDTIITSRVGPEQNLYSINMTDSVMELMLLVPER